MEWITLIESENPSRLGKLYKLGSDGKLHKHAVANITRGTATAIEMATPIDFAALLRKASELENAAIMSGRLSGANRDEAVTLVTEKELGRLLGSEGQTPGGVHEVDGGRYAARLKRGIEPGSWVLIDADNPLGIPAAWAEMTIGERLELLEPILPGITTCLRIEYRASSARAVKTGVEPGKATHAWIQISDPGKLDELRNFLVVQTQLHGVSFLSPRHSRETGEVIGAQPRTVIDLAVFVSGRLAFCAKPNVEAKGYFVADADVTIVNPEGGVLNVSGIALPGAPDLAELEEKTGQALSFSLSNGGVVATDRSSLTMDTPIEIKGRIAPFHAVVANMTPGEKLRCEAPFRESCSEAAFISVKPEGEPYVHDVGLGTTYWLDPMKRQAWLLANTQKPTDGVSSRLVVASPAGGAVAPQDADWPDPVPLRASLPEAPVFDMAMLPDAYQDFARDTAERMGVPYDYLGVPLMLASAAALGSGWAICPKAKDKGWKQTAVLWGGIVAPPGAKKSPCLQLVSKPLIEIEGELHDKYKTEKAQYDLAIGAHKKGTPPVFLGTEPKLERVTVQDTTYQKLAEICSTSPSGVLATWDEIAGMVAAWQQKGQEAARGFFLSSWSGDQVYTVDRKESGTTRIDPLFIVISGGVQPSVLGSLVRDAQSTGTSNDGLLQRFQLFVFPDQSQAPPEVDRPADEAAQRTAFEALKGLRALSPYAIGAETEQQKGRGLIHFDDDAQSVFDALRGKIEKSAKRNGKYHVLVLSHFAKMPGAIAALAMIIHLLDEGTALVSGRSIKKAVSWAVYLRAHAERIYALSHHATMDAARCLLARLEEGQLKEPFTARDVYRKSWANLKDNDAVERALDELVATHWLRGNPVQGQKGGRPTVAYVVNPKILRG